MFFDVLCDDTISALSGFFGSFSSVALQNLHFFVILMLLCLNVFPLVHFLSLKLMLN